MNDFKVLELEHERSVGVNPCRGHAKCQHCGKCVSLECHGPFRDRESFSEFRISGICQACQDELFGGEA